VRQGEESISGESGERGRNPYFMSEHKICRGLGGRELLISSEISVSEALEPLKSVGPEQTHDLLSERVVLWGWLEDFLPRRTHIRTIQDHFSRN